MLATITLLIHILSGYTALLTGSIAMLVKKGKGLHQIAGRAFYFSMIGVSISALILSYLKSSSFLFYVGIFAFYQNHMGRKAIVTKTAINDRMDWAVAFIAAFNAGAMFSHGNPILIVFGVITLILLLRDIQLWNVHRLGKPIPKLRWLGKHIGMMMGAYIATITAFLVVNINDVQPAWLVWLGPTFVLVPLLQYWIWKYSVKPIQNAK